MTATSVKAEKVEKLNELLGITRKDNVVVPRVATLGSRIILARMDEIFYWAGGPSIADDNIVYLTSQDLRKRIGNLLQDFYSEHFMHTRDLDASITKIVDALEEAGVVHQVPVEINCFFGTFYEEGFGLVTSGYRFNKEAVGTSRDHQIGVVMTWNECLNCLRNPILTYWSDWRDYVENPQVWKVLQYLTMKCYLREGISTYTVDEGMTIRAYTMVGLGALYQRLLNFLEWSTENSSPRVTERWYRLVSEMINDRVFRASLDMKTGLQVVVMGEKFYTTLQSLKDEIRTSGVFFQLSDE